MGNLFFFFGQASEMIEIYIPLQFIYRQARRTEPQEQSAKIGCVARNWRRIYPTQGSGSASEIEARKCLTKGHVVSGMREESIDQWGDNIPILAF